MSYKLIAPPVLIFFYCTRFPSTKAVVLSGRISRCLRERNLQNIARLSLFNGDFCFNSTINIFVFFMGPFSVLLYRASEKSIYLHPVFNEVAFSLARNNILLFSNTFCSLVSWPFLSHLAPIPFPQQLPSRFLPLFLLPLIPFITMKKL